MNYRLVKGIYFAIELSLRKIPYVVYVHALNVRSRDAQ